MVELHQNVYNSTNHLMKLSLPEDFVSNIIVTIVISNKSCCRHILFMNLSEFNISFHQGDISKIYKVPFGFLFSGEVWYCSKFWSQHNRKPPRQLVCIVFWSGIRSNGPKMPIFGPKCQFWAKFGRFWAQNPIFWGQGVKILVPSYRDSNETPFLCFSVRLQLAARGQNVLF